MALINETNQQYYAGAQGFTVQDAAGQQDFTFTFDTNLVFGDSNPNSVDYALNNFKLFTLLQGPLKGPQEPGAKRLFVLAAFKCEPLL